MYLLFNNKGYLEREKLRKGKEGDRITYVIILSSTCYFCYHKALHSDILYKGRLIVLCTHCFNLKKHIKEPLKFIDGYLYDEHSDTLKIGNTSVGRLSYLQFFKNQ